VSNWTITIRADVTITPPPPAWSPSQIPRLQLWLKADAGTYQNAALTTPALLDAAPVGGWQDQSGNANNEVQSSGGARPQLKLAAVNGLPVVRPDGLADCLSTAGSMTHNIGTGDWWLALVLQTPAVVAGMSRPLASNGNYSPGWYVGNTGGVPEMYNGGAKSFMSALAGETPYLLEFWRAAGIVYAALNGLQDATAFPFTYSLPNAPFQLWTDSSAFGTSDLGEVVFSASAPGANQAPLRSYVQGRWGVG
jgi:hypothetical protein